MFYSPTASMNGAKLLANKGPPRKANVEDMADSLATPAIMVPGANEGLGDGIIRTNKRKRDMAKMDPRKARRPELPVTGPGKGGRVGASATQHVVQNLVRDTTRDEDVSPAPFRLRSKLRRSFGRSFPPPARVVRSGLSLLTLVFCSIATRGSASLRRQGGRLAMDFRYVSRVLVYRLRGPHLPAAWQANQPKPVFAEAEQEEEDEENK